MTHVNSRVTAQGQISVPAEIRKKLGIGPGSVLEWDQRGGQVFVRKAGRYSSAEVHAVLFDTKNTPAKKAANIKTGIKQYIRKRHARG